MKPYIHTQDLASVESSQADVSRVVYKSKKCILKTYKFKAYTQDLEAYIWNKLKDERSPHFCPIYLQSDDSIVVKEISHKHENECKQNTLGDALTFKMYSADALLGCILQALYAIPTFQKHDITHYDLHTDNVMISNTRFDIHVYQRGDGDFAAVQTFGISPVFIDFGFAFVKDYHLCTSVIHNHGGYTTYAFDEFVDARMLLVSSVSDLTDLFKEFPDHCDNLEERDTLQHYMKNVKKIIKPLPTLQNNGSFKNAFPNFKRYLNNVVRSTNERRFGRRIIQDPADFFEIIQYIIFIPINHTNNDIFYQYDTLPILKTATPILKTATTDSDINTLQDAVRKSLYTFVKTVGTVDLKTLKKMTLYTHQIIVQPDSYKPGVFELYGLVALYKLCRAYFFLLKHVVEETEQQKKTINNIDTSTALTALKLKRITFTSGMKVLFVHANKTLVLDQQQAQTLNTDDSSWNELLAFAQ